MERKRTASREANADGRVQPASEIFALLDICLTTRGVPVAEREAFRRVKAELLRRMTVDRTKSLDDLLKSRKSRALIREVFALLARSAARKQLAQTGRA